MLFATLAGLFATSFPATILSVSLTDIAKEFDSTTSTMTWVISAPMLLSALSLPILGKFGDMYGHRKVFLWGSAIATGVSALTAIAWGPLSLISFRSLQQIIGGATQPTSMAIVMLVFPPKDRVKALGYWTFVTAGAPAIGLAAGGPLVDIFGWRTIFIIQAALGAIAFVIALYILPESEPKRVRFDIPGAITISLAVGAVMLLLTNGLEWGASSPIVWVLLAITPVAIYMFIRVEKVASAPLIPLEYLSDRNFVFNMLTSLFMGAAYLGGFVMSPIALRDAFGLSATTTATVMLLRTGFYSISSPIGGQLGARIGNKPAIIWGSSFLAGSMAIFVAGTHFNMLYVFCFALVAQGVGNGFARPSTTANLANSVPETDLGLAAAMQRMSTQIGNSFGVAAMSAVYNNSGTPQSFSAPFIVGVVVSVLAAITAVFMLNDSEAAEAAQRLKDRVTQRA